MDMRIMPERVFVPAWVSDEMKCLRQLVIYFRNQNNYIFLYKRQYVFTMSPLQMQQTCTKKPSMSIPLVTPSSFSLHSDPRSTLTTSLAFLPLMALVSSSMWSITQPLALLCNITFPISYRSIAHGLPPSVIFNLAINQCTIAASPYITNFYNDPLSTALMLLMTFPMVSSNVTFMSHLTYDSQTFQMTSSTPYLTRLPILPLRDPIMLHYLAFVSMLQQLLSPLFSLLQYSTQAMASLPL
jgi:hypothetical protein